MFRIATTLAIFAFALLSGAAQAQQTTLRIHHFLSDRSPAHGKLILPWAERVEAQSGGRLKVEVYPRMGLGGKPPELYRQVRDGAVDVVWTLAGYTPGLFPRAEVFELPSVHRGSARATNLAIQEVFSLIAEDFADVQPILIHVHAGNALHLIDRTVNRPDDALGLRLRTPSRTGAWLLNDWGAEAVGMPVPAIPGALSGGVVDGALVPFEIVPPLKLQTLTQYSIEGAGGERFGTSVFIFAMNKARYESLPDDLKRVIDANSGPQIAASIGEAWDAVEEVGKRLQRESGGEIVKLSGADFAAFDMAKVTERWIAEMTAIGIDARRLVEEASAAVARNER